MRLPRAAHLGRGYRVRVALAAQRLIREVAGIEEGDQDLGGYFDSALDEVRAAYAGTIYILSTLPLQKKRETYWVGLQHAITDVADWDREHPGLARRLPNVVHLGCGYRVRVSLASQSVIKEFLEEDDASAEYFGACDTMFEEAPKSAAGVVYVLRTAPQPLRWITYWHELKHVVTDLGAWDREHPVVI